MQGYSYKSVKKVKLDSVEGCVALHLHGVLSTNLKRGSSITYLHSRLIISSQIEEVLTVVWDKISKSRQRVTTSRLGGLCPVRDNSLSHQ